ncbi:hypothetical protein CONLIGDRAFT_686011 [Coniochaeta ligniaria NRRL 30616]|uniref:Uncharacterized protein n=1 Tax=Coniochaeta ligniaria NRRL 30616 TaxID=1408157 RepID=A0A1J7IRQ0_9PEZI|nr:hypothetical protein CONLIGDRAFT_686011 [Coniochaeta ligniaria NRRL 30616]
MSDSKRTIKQKAWMRHDKTKNGYIVRMQLDNGYKAYRPEPASCLHIGNRWTSCDGPRRGCHYWNRYLAYHAAMSEPTEIMEHRRINLKDSAWVDLNRDTKKQPVPYRPSSPGSPKKSVMSRPPWAPNDPIEEGRDLAADSSLPLPSDKVVGFWHGVRVLAPDSEEKELEDLRRRGLLYDETRASPEDLRLGDIVREEPVYSIRQVARRKGKGKAVPEAELDEESGDFFVPEDAFESWAEFAEQSGFEFVLLDDLVSNPESWVELEQEAGGS